MAQQKLLIETKNNHVTHFTFPFCCSLWNIPLSPFPISASKKICPSDIGSLLESCVLFEQKTLRVTEEFHCPLGN